MSRTRFGDKWEKRKEIEKRVNEQDTELIPRLVTINTAGKKQKDSNQYGAKRQNG